MLKRKYCLLLIKETTHHKVPMVLHRKNGKFQLDYEVYDKYLMNWLQVWYWYWLIYLYGRWGSQRFFKYQLTTGRVIVKKAIS